MSIPHSHRKALLSLAYLESIASAAGVQFQPANASDYGADGVLTRITLNSLGQITPTGHTIQIQLKSTSTATIGEANVAYEMDAEAYNKLAVWEGPRCLLMLFVVPEQIDDWTSFTEDVGQIRNCLYWFEVPSSPTDNTSSITIQIPRNNLVDEQVLNDLLDRRRNGSI